jgi:hypothetical protein
MVRRGCTLRLGALAALAATLAAAGCGSFEDPTIVLDLRVLAVQAQPPELVLDFDPEDPVAVVPQLDANPITVSALVADPGASRRLAWDMVACPPTNDQRCDPEDPSTAVGSGVVADPETSALRPTATFVVGLDVLEESVRADSLAGFGGVAVQVQLRVWPEGGDPATDAVWASKRLLYAPRVPAQRVANTNPTLDALLVDAEPTMPLAPARCEDGAASLEVAPQEDVLLLPVEPDGVRETYVLPTFDGGVRTITENLRYAWLATAGGWSSGASGGPIDAFGNQPKLERTWTAPRAPGDVRLWLVQRDERGGLAWTEYCVRVK